MLKATCATKNRMLFSTQKKRINCFMVDLVGSTIIHKMYIDFAFIQKSGKSFSVEV